uniref:Uncharacterized protein n=1 Tax=Physcomitrium patens TaxID=3218 RepID=A0A2K1JCF2_PHYPA|nr:hypothetical protein PHYPA_019478 [Physcomitrium patens]
MWICQHRISCWAAVHHHRCPMFPFGCTASALSHPKGTVSPNPVNGFLSLSLFLLLNFHSNSNLLSELKTLKFRLKRLAKNNDTY